MTVFKVGDPVTVAKRPGLPAPEHLGRAHVIWVGYPQRQRTEAKLPSRYEVAMEDGSGTCMVFPDELEARS